MLVLSRRVGDSIAIGDDIEVTILDVRSDVVRVGIAAPRHVRVHRAELLAQLESANKQAASPDPGVVESLSRSLRDQRPPSSQPQQPSSQSQQAPSSQEPEGR